MSRIKIISNPYTREVCYKEWSNVDNDWKNVIKSSDRSKLLEIDYTKAFFPFKVWDICDIIKEEYGGDEPIEVEFEGTQNEYCQLSIVCNDEAFMNDIVLKRSNRFLNNANVIFDDIKKNFNIIYPIVLDIMKDDKAIKTSLNKIAKTLDDVIPVCVFGNYSAGKSSFISALIGAEILPCGSEPLTAKIYEIRNSEIEDEAKISCGNISIIVRNNHYEVTADSSNLNISNELEHEVNNTQDKKIDELTRIILRYLNGYKFNDDTDDWNNVIRIEYPFCKKGLIGKSNNKFVIFDTPGSNANTNKEHAEVLSQAMQDFSNGISILVTNYDDYKSEDNAKLSDELLKIEALDNRFTMIIFNKADSEYPEDEDNLDVVLESDAISKMYSSGIFFVSSIMGLGAKNNGEFAGKRFARTYREKCHSFSDSSDEISYMSLYQYNIMPEHIKKEVVEYSKECADIVYANSGLYCVEREIENFGSKHSTYNKCRMVYSFLNDIIDKTNIRIAEQEEALQEILGECEESFKECYIELEKKLDDKTEELKKFYHDDSIKRIIEHVKNTHVINLNSGELTDIDNNFRRKTFEEGDYNSTKSKFAKTRDALREHMEENIQGLLVLDFKESFKITVEDLKNAYNSKDELDERKKELEKESSDQLMKYVVTMYNNCLESVCDLLSNYLSTEWNNIETNFKNEIVSLISNSENLSAQENHELISIIDKFDINDFKKKAESLFDKKRFLKGAILGITIFAGERLDIDSLTDNYNKTINKSIEIMSLRMNSEYYDKFIIWEDELTNEIKAKLTQLNPELSSKASELHSLNERIRELKTNKCNINYAYESVKNDMEWKSTIGE